MTQLEQVKQAGRRLALWKLAVRPQFLGFGLGARFYSLVAHWRDSLELSARDTEELGTGDENGNAAVKN